MKKLCLIFVLLFIFFASGIVKSSAQVILYDDFSSDIIIDPNKWFGYEHDPSLTARECVREIKNNSLHMSVRGYGMTTSDEGSVSGGPRLCIADPSSVTRMKAVLTVKECAVTGPPSNANAATARVRLHGYFFNTEISTPGDSRNDVIASIGISRTANSSDPEGALTVGAYVFHCGDKDCNSGTPIGSITLGTVNVGSKTKLFMEWDQEEGLFNFSYDGNPKVSIRYPGLSNISKPGSNLKRIDVTYNAGNSTGNQIPMAFIDAYVHKVLINE